jgi:hypothetical protein
MTPIEHELCEHLERDALLADLARPLVHEFNNFLNSLVLHIAVIHAKGADVDLVSLGKEIDRIGRFLHDWQSRPRSPIEKQFRTIDLNEVVRGALQSVDHEGKSRGDYLVELAPEPLPVQSAPSEVGRLCRLLLQASARSGDGKCGSARTERHQRQAVLMLHSRGVNWSQAALDGAFHLRSESALELAAAKGMAERLQCQLDIGNHPAGGLVIKLVLALAAAQD